MTVLPKCKHEFPIESIVPVAEMPAIPPNVAVEGRDTQDGGGIQDRRCIHCGAIHRTWACVWWVQDAKITLHQRTMVLKSRIFWTMTTLACVFGAAVASFFFDIVLGRPTLAAINAILALVNVACFWKLRQLYGRFYKDGER